MSDKKSKKYYFVIPVCSFFISLFHFISALFGKSNMIGIFCSVMLSSIVSLIMYFAFENAIKNEDFTLIAGHKKSYEDNLLMYARQLRMMSVFVSAFSLLLNILYFAVYGLTAEKQMSISLTFLFVFMIGMISFIFVIKYKYKKYFNDEGI